MILVSCEAVGDASRNDGDITRFEGNVGAVRTTELDFYGGAGAAEDLMRAGMIMLNRINPVDPGAAPAMRCKGPDHGIGTERGTGCR